MRRAFTALIAGSLLVGLAVLLGRLKIATPIPFFVLLPGILTGAMVPGSGFNPEGDTHPWGLLSMIVVFAVNIMLYTSLVWLVLGLLRYGSRRASN